MSSNNAEIQSSEKTVTFASKPKLITVIITSLRHEDRNKKQ